MNGVIAQAPSLGANAIRVGARTGERLVVVGPTSSEARVPEGVTVVGEGDLKGGHRVWIHEVVADRRWRVSAKAFFQASPEGAEALVAAVGALIDEHAPDAQRLVDLCCGVGLFAGTVGAGRTSVGVERSAASVADARQNLGDLDARVVKVALARWRPSPADVVVADPARSGLGSEGVPAVHRHRCRPVHPRELAIRRRSDGTRRCWPTPATSTSGPWSSTSSGHQPHRGGLGFQKQRPQGRDEV